MSAMPYLLSATTVVSLALLTACSGTPVEPPAQAQNPVSTIAGAAKAGASPAVAMPAASPSLKHVDLPRWVEHLQPQGDELSYQAIEWIADFSEGLSEADARQLPMFFWAMNGHPLGCT